MNFFKNVWSDLVERRLWPVAVGLLVALVALPVLLGRSGGSSSDTALPPANATANGTPAAQLVSLSTLKPKGAPLGPRHNPFRNVGGPAAASTAAPADATSPAVSSVVGGSSGSASSSSGASAPSGPSVSAPSDTAISTPSTPPASTPVGDTRPRSYSAGYRVDVTYGRSGSLNPHDDLARLDPLSALQAPLVLFLGVKDDRQSAIFMVLTDAALTGDGDCRPSADDCQVFGLKKGDAELFDVPASDGRALRYELQVDKIAPKTTTSWRAGVNARHRESKLGRSLLRQAVAATKDAYVAKYRYALGKGVVTKVMPRAAK